jgi:hypothetical protein
VEGVIEFYPRLPWPASALLPEALPVHVSWSIVARGKDDRHDLRAGWRARAGGGPAGLWAGGQRRPPRRPPRRPRKAAASSGGD